MTITEFLLARIAEDEEMCSLFPEGPHALYEDGVLTRLDPEDTWDDGDQRAPNRHIGWTQIDPRARVLAECKAKRAIVELHKPWGFEYSGGEGCGRCGSPDNYAVYPLPDSERFPCATLRLLASVYADHPDFEQAWRT